MTESPSGPGKFIVTKEHRLFTEFADAVRKHRYIGLCYGAAGVGKTLSARRYARWDVIGSALEQWNADVDWPKVNELAVRSRTVIYTPTVLQHIKHLDDDLHTLFVHMGRCIDEGEREQGVVPSGKKKPSCSPELLIIDEAERLAVNALELVRDLFDRFGIGLILIGMPGMEKRLSRFPQLYSRVGFAHHYRPLHGDELAFVLTHHWRHLGLALDEADFTDAQAIASIARITGGNFRLLQRLFVQISRILKINGLTVITDDVVEAARSTLVIGAT